MMFPDNLCALIYATDQQSVSIRHNTMLSTLEAAYQRRAKNTQIPTQNGLFTADVLQIRL